MRKRRLVVVGASLAGLSAVREARAAGFDGDITLLGDERHPPYNRPPLSKAFLTADLPPAVELASSAELSGLHVDLRLGRAATALDPSTRTLTVAGGQRLGYDGLVIATGVRARGLPGLPELAGIHRLRTLDDAVAIRAAIRAGAHVMVIGAGFIGSELASSARAAGSAVTLVETQPAPLVRAVGRRMGEALARFHLDNGASVRCGTKVEAVEGAGRVERVRLSDGTVHEVDLLVLGVGAEPATAWLESSGLTVGDGVCCDSGLRAGPPGVYAVGDVARWANPLFPGSTMRLEHWTNAADSGRHATRAWLAPGRHPDYRTVPYFWSDWYGKRIQFVGVSTADEIVVADGSVAAGRFVALYRKADRLVGALLVSRPSLTMKIRALIAEGIRWEQALGIFRSSRSTRDSPLP
jgi:NADPH-dependent 2,4-dienoyl-CoA reductase/sulfur reductase-like enzyme